MISHVFIGISDFAAAYRFHAAVMAALGHAQRFCDDSKPWAAWQPAGGGRPLFIIGRPYDGAPANPGNGPMTALLAPSRAAVDAAHAAALASGGSCEGPACVRTTMPITTAPTSATRTATNSASAATTRLKAACT